MKQLSSAQVRQMFLDFFQSKGHTIEPSASLIPVNDPTLLWINSGVATLKKYFDGSVVPENPRITNAQKSIRTNDIENVGKTARHHTMFEMLGNFSIGDYFKNEAIHWAWEFLTSPEWMAFDPEKLYVTVYPKDTEAKRIWHEEVGLPLDHIVDVEDNFWDIGAGPCGPDTEIFYDRGEAYNDVAEDDPENYPGGENERYLEIWNLVFSEFNHKPDNTFEPLPHKNIDTGMGLERMVSIVQDAPTNFETDLFLPIIHAVEKLSNQVKYGENPTTDISYKVIADHIRALSFAIGDGALPSNEGRGYVLRRIIRRAVRHGNKLGATGSFFHKMLQPLIEVMGEAYPELAAQQARIEAQLLKEEEQFAKTLEQGLKLLEGELAQLKGSVIPGEVVFKLYDTYGFPTDLTADIARERDLSIDEAGFEVEMAAQRQRARDAGKFAIDYNSVVKVEGETQFDGYDATAGEGQIIAIYKDGEQVDEVVEGDEALIVLNQTPFYAESGGQIGDTGIFKNYTGIFEVQDTKKSGGAFVHQGIVTMGNLKVTQNVEATVQAEIRAATARNHSATHLLHAALRQILGSHVQQKGSLVASDVLRFDFANDQPVSFEQLQEIERLVNAEVIANTAVSTELLDIESAKAKGAMMLFGEKYGDEVRVLSMGSVIEEKNFSIELCGGIHVKRTGDIGLFKITSEGGVAAGIRRIEAVTGTKAVEVAQKADRDINTINGLLKAQKDQTLEKVEALVDTASGLQKQIEQLNQKLASLQAGELLSQVQTIAGRATLITTVENMDAKALRNLHDGVKSKLENAVIVLAGVEGDKVSLIASVAKDFTASIKAGDIIKHLATELGGKGGGKPDLAQGGAPLNEKFAPVMADLTAWLAAK